MNQNGADPTEAEYDSYETDLNTLNVHMHYYRQGECLDWTNMALLSNRRLGALLTR